MNFFKIRTPYVNISMYEVLSSMSGFNSLLNNNVNSSSTGTSESHKTCLVQLEVKVQLEIKAIKV